MSEIILISKEGTEFKVDYQFTNMCQLVKVAMEDNEDWNRIPLDMISATHIQWIIEFCQRHKYNEPDLPSKPLPSNELGEYLDDPKDLEFFNSLSLDQIVDFLNDWDYLNIPSLIELLAAVIAIRFRGKDFEQIKDEFGIEEDFTPDEEEKQKKEFSWILETDGGSIADFGKKMI